MLPAHNDMIQSTAMQKSAGARTCTALTDTRSSHEWLREMAQSKLGTVVSHIRRARSQGRLSYYLPMTYFFTTVADSHT